MMYICQIVVGFHHFNVFDAQVHSQDWVNYLSSTMLNRRYCRLWWYYSNFISGWASRSRREWCEEWSLVRSHSSHCYNDDDDLTRRVWTILMRSTLNTATQYWWGVHSTQLHTQSLSIYLPLSIQNIWMKSFYRANLQSSDQVFSLSVLFLWCIDDGHSYPSASLSLIPSFRYHYIFSLSTFSPKQSTRLGGFYFSCLIRNWTFLSLK